MKTEKKKKKRILALLIVSAMLSGALYRVVRLQKESVNFIQPSEGTYHVGDVFTFPITVDDSGTYVNALQADIGFDPQHVQAIAVTTHGSFAKIFLEKVVDNERGFIRLTGGLANPGHKGQGLFGTVYFRAVAEGDTSIHYLESCQILANDGQGTDTITHFPHVPVRIHVADADDPLSPATVLIPPEKTDGQLQFYEYSSKNPTPPIEPHPSHHPEQLRHAN